ncbi:putative cytokinetic ring protein SteA [Calderihabitans maritimus]|uniref:Thiamin pyrophosphokinase catalytic region n=1 Tax=Calderihabitans maritimus TaxID=1246530 RepID=A0A1Z5HQW7_9FIRM|nr:Thiamin pyrophosphokinase catalytic region [Calderihabitans maritimus]
MYLKGRARVDRKTKNLIKRLQPGDIAIIDHEDLDELAAESLIAARVRAVINASPSISGKYPNLGPLNLVQAGIPLLDQVGSQVLEKLQEGDEVEIRGNCLYGPNGFLAEGIWLDEQKIRDRLEDTKENFQREIEQFVQNTLEYAWKELDIITGRLPVPPLKVSFARRHSLIVVRGQNYREDLQAIKIYIEEMRPVLIGVDGGADALLEFGYRPDIIIGDMDSVSDRALKCGAELVVHAYPDGRAPGRKRLEQLGLPFVLLPFPGTSEDVAMLLAYEMGTELIVAVGSHSNIIDFLEKGRKGMASTFLARLKVGSILVDAKGVSKLYRQTLKFRYVIEIVIAALIPFTVVLMVSPATYQLLRLLLLKLRFLFALAK